MNSTLFKDYGKIIIRRPLYSYLSLFNEGNKTKNLNEVIECLLKDPVFMEAIYWSSPQLYQRVVNFKNGHFKSDSYRECKENKLKVTLMKYAIRASSRCTPYGIFAGSAIANIGKRESPPVERIERKVRIDVGLLLQIKSVLEADPLIWPALHYSVNNSLYIIPGQYRFIEAILENGKTRYQISSIEKTEFLDKIISLTKVKAVTIKDIHALVNTEFEYEEIKGFAFELIKNQFLNSELQLGVTIENNFERIKNILERLPVECITGVNKYIKLFSGFENILKKFANLPIGKFPIKEINQLEILLEEIGIAGKQEHLFQADLKQVIPATFLFPEERLNELEESIAIMGKLTERVSPHDEQLENFKKRFSEKYETQEIPLTEALDPEFGIGFPVTKSIGNIFHNSLIEKINSDPKTKKTEKINDWLIDKNEDFENKIIKEGIQINQNDLRNFDNKIEQLPNNFSVMGTLLPDGKILLHSVGGAHANSLLGRFAYLDERMQSLCHFISYEENEENTGIVFAEIIYFPEGRIGNIARRPPLSEYEIPLLASSALQTEKQLPIEDLMISVQQNEIVIRSKKLDKRVIPRLSNAHNYSNSHIPAYKFLCAIQYQGISGFNINWKGAFTNEKHFFPRLYFKNIIFHRAYWLFYEKDISTIINSNNPVEKLKTICIRWSIPEYVSLSQGDNELFIDTTNDSYLQVLLEEMRNAKVIKLVEWLHAGDKNFRNNPDIIQFILPLSKIAPAAISPLEKHTVASHPVQRTFVPGSEWLYFKIYCGAQLSDDILLHVVRPSILSLLKREIISNAFFICYTDPHYHIRFRLHLSGNEITESLSIALKYVYDLLQPYCENRSVWKVQLDTYKRELERYGEDSILDSEDAFFHDSMLYLRCLEHDEFANNEQTRFLASLINVDQWLCFFGMSSQEKACFCKEMSDAFGLEMERNLKPHFDLKYREMKNIVSDFFINFEFNDEFCERNKNLCLKPLPLENASSYIHMSMNRWFAVEQRKMEYMAYVFCLKYYNQLSHKMDK